MNQENLAQSLRITEQTLLASMYHTDLCDYKGLDAVQDIVDTKPTATVPDATNPGNDFDLFYKYDGKLTQVFFG